jgi:hypothetical protein
VATLGILMGAAGAVVQLATGDTDFATYLLGGACFLLLMHIKDKLDERK